MWVPAFRAARSFKNGAASGSAYVQPRIGWYLWLYSMCIVARRDFVLSWSVWKELSANVLSANVIEAVGLI